MKLDLSLLKRVISFLALLILLKFPCFALSLTDSLEQLLQKNNNPLKRLEILLAIANIKYAEGDHHSLIYTEGALALADSLKLKDKIADANYLSGLAWKLCGDNSTCILRLYNAAELYNELNLKNKYATIIQEIGETYRANGNHLTSLEYLDKALKMQIELADTLEIAKTYNRLAAVNYEIFVSRKAYQQFIKSENTTKESINFLFKCTPSLKQCYDSTMQFLLLSDKIARLKTQKELIISNSIIHGAQYSAIFEFEKADSILTLALKMIEAEKIEKDQALVLYNIARLRMNQKEYNKAIGFALEAFNLANKNDTRIYRLLSSNLLGELYQKVNSPNEAIKFMNISQNEIAYFYKNDLGLRINTLEYQSEINKRKAELLLQTTKTKYLGWFLIYIFILFLLFLTVIYLKNKKLKKLNQKLERSNITIAEQNKELTNLNSEKDRFFSIIAHDLRGPLGTFVSITDLITEELQKNRIEKVKLLSDNLQIVSYHLFALLENLLDWSRLQRNAINFSPETIKLKNFIEDSIMVIADGAERKGISINYNIADWLEVNTDSHMFQTVIRNLVSNAIKYTSEGGSILISAKSNSGNTIISVTDSGIGMSKDIIKELFTLNSSTNRLGTNHEPSTGLGLILCKEFVDKMGGSISVESEVGKGSKFTIQLPEQSKKATSRNDRRF